jgi:hypothetical protein
MMFISSVSRFGCMHVAIAACLVIGAVDVLYAAPKDASDNADDDGPKPSLVLAPDNSAPAKSLNGNISIEENMRLRRDLYEYSRAVDPAHIQIEERRRVMHQRLQARFDQADKDNDGAISRIEAFELLPQIARHFSQVDANNDGVITMEELESAQAKAIERQQRPIPVVREEAQVLSSPKLKEKGAMVNSRKRAL